MPAIPHMESSPPAKTSGIRSFCGDLVHTLRNFRIAEKISGIAALLVIVMALMVVMSI